MKKINYMEPLSSFAISLAAGIVLDYYKFTQSTVKNELKSAFKKALKLWSKNGDIRERNRGSLERKFSELFASPENLADIQTTDPDLDSFLKKYDEAISEYHSAYNYLKGIKDLERFKREIELLESIRDSLDELNEKVDYLNGKLQNVNLGIDKEWIRQLEVYKTSIQNFKPKTALALIIALENSFGLNDYKPGNAINATIEFLKGQCYEFIGNTDEMHKCYIKAYKFDNSSITYKEKASFAYVITKKVDDAIVLAKEILQFDDFNVIAWAVTTLTSEEKDLVKLLSEVPDLLREDDNFKRIIFVTTRLDKQFTNVSEAFEQYNILPVLPDDDIEPLSFNNFKNRAFLIESIFIKILNVVFFDFNTSFTGDKEVVLKFKPILEDFLKQLENSEIKDRFSTIDFFNSYFEFVLNGNEDSVIKMKAILESSNFENDFHIMFLTNCLQLIGKEKDAIEIINKKEKSKEARLLEAHCYLKLGNIDKYISLINELLATIDHVDINTCHSLLSIQHMLLMHNRLSDLITDKFIKDKSFEHSYLKVLLKSFSCLPNDSDKDIIISNAKEIEEEVIKSDTGLIFYISLIYYKLSEFQLAIESFKKYVNEDSPSKELYYYILSLEKSQTNHKHLLFLLEKWRKQFPYHEELLRIEADLRRQLSDWKSCSEIAKYYLTQYPTDESFLTLELIAINELEQPNKKERIQELSNFFRDFDFQHYVYAQNVARVLFQNGYHEISLEIQYKKAIHSNNIKARMDYFFLVVQMPAGIIKEREEVKLGDYVSYSINEETKFLEISRGNDLAEKLIGHKKGDTVSVERPYTRQIDNITVKRIMDKYLYLHDLILEEVQSNPYSGFPMQSIKFEDTTPEGMNKTFVSLFGADGTFRKEESENSFKKYYEYKLSFTEIVIQNLNSDYIGGYFHLVNFRDGVTLVPMPMYPDVSLTENTELILDYSALLIVFQISREQGIEYKSQFIIPKGIVDFVRLSLKKEKAQPKERMSVDVSLDGVTPNILTEETVKSNILYFENLLKWIEHNCHETIAESKLDVTRKLGGKIDNAIFIDYMAEIVSLMLESEERILVTDDTMFFKFFPIQSQRTISSELYFKKMHNENNAINIEFIKNKYIGFTLNAELLHTEYQKKLKGQDNLYTNCITNISLLLVPSKETVLTAISFLKKLALVPFITEETFRQDATFVLVNLLKGQKEIKPFRISLSLINRDFKHLGKKLDLVLESYNDALTILNISHP